MAGPLPLHPIGGVPRSPGPGQELRARRDAIRERIGTGGWRAGCRGLLSEAARATLRLTGIPEAEGRDALGALARLERAAEVRDPTMQLIAEVHGIVTGGAGASAFRASQIEPQFPGSSLSPPQTIPLRFGELLDWISGASGRDLETAPRAALFFARFLEISPFARANFRVAHLMLSFFALADDQPPIWFEVEDAPGIREDVSRAFRFDTGPLTARIETALRRSLARIHDAR